MSAFTMALNGVVDAEVNGGIRMYREAFLTNQYLQENPNMEEWVNRLKAAIKESVRIVGKALDIHRVHCPTNLSQLQEKLDSKC